MGTFDGLQIGTSGIFAARQGVDVAGQNIANVNTPGYSRQRADLRADSGPVTPAIFSRWTGGGLGVRQAEILRIRDQFIDRRAREESAVKEELDVTRETYDAIERVFAEPSDTGLAGVISEFFSSWDDVANRPTDQSARAQLAERGELLATRIGQLELELGSIRDVSRSRLETVVSELNTAAVQVAELQNTIRNAKVSGINANELEDQRDLILQQMAERTGGNVRVDEEGVISFFIGSVALVRGIDSIELAVEEDVTGTVDVVWAKDGASAGVRGQLGGELQTVNTLIPEYLDHIEALETTLHDEVNALHATGFDATGAPGGPFFQLGAEGIEMNPAVLADPGLVAAAGTAGTVDGSVALEMAELRGTVENYRELVVRLGVESLGATRRADLQDAVLSQITDEQEAVNGVNMDEELANLVKFQRAYEANARFISTVDGLLETLLSL